MGCGCRVHTVGMGGWIDLCARHAVIEEARQLEQDQALSRAAEAARATIARAKGA